MGNWKRREGGAEAAGFVDGAAVLRPEVLDGPLMIDPTAEVAVFRDGRRQCRRKSEEGCCGGVQLLKQFVNGIFNTRFGWRAGMKRLEDFTLEFDFT
uniref:Uncharacterized protein n=1 Tax=Oryza meridionalis TaxID=40149 RepID=A0A0E0F968_9ORYZ